MHGRALSLIDTIYLPASSSEPVAQIVSNGLRDDFAEVATGRRSGFRLFARSIELVETGGTPQEETRQRRESSRETGDSLALGKNYGGFSGNENRKGREMERVGGCSCVEELHLHTEKERKRERT